MKRSILAYAGLSALLSPASAVFAQTFEALKERAGSRFGEGTAIESAGDGVPGTFGSRGSDLTVAYHDRGHERGHDHGRDRNRDSDHRRHDPDHEERERRREEWRRREAERVRAEQRADALAAGVVLGALAINAVAGCAAEQARHRSEPPPVEATTGEVIYR
ncbi:MAG: hypothetical protein HY553_16300 [Elusimicrobia bacterium]|nr:hypothetical protein [Elusimicrobiota bacterium]